MGLTVGYLRMSTCRGGQQDEVGEMDLWPDPEGLCFVLI